MSEKSLKDMIADSLIRRDESREKAIERKKEQRHRYPLGGLKRATAWALQHFNANQPEERNTLLAPSFQVRFEYDRMFVSPQMYGMSFGFEFEYVLSNTALGLAWIGRNPMTGFALPPLWVTGMFYEEEQDEQTQD